MIQRISSLMRKSVPDVSAEGLLIANGKAMPADGTSGYQKGCLFIDTVAGVVYVNEGTFASSDFNAVQTA